MVDRLLVIDTETTGLDSKNNQILQLSAIYYEYGKEVSKFDKYILLELDFKNVSLGALKVNKTKFKDVLTKTTSGGGSTSRYSEKEIVFNFCDWLLELNLAKDTLLVGQNVSFDLNFIKELFIKYNVSNWESVLPYRTYDTMSIHYLLSRTGIIDDSYDGSLGKIAAKLGIDTTTLNLHNSLEDVRLTANIVFVAEVKLKEMKKVYDLYLKSVR